MEDAYSDKVAWKINEEFSWLKDECYLDFAGAGLYSSIQLQKSTQDLCKSIYGNPHSQSSSGRHTADVIDQIRFRLLELFKTNAEDYSLVFTSGATQAIKTVLENFIWRGKPEIISSSESKPAYGTYAYTAVNHTSVVGGRILAEDRGASILCIPEENAEKVLSNEKTQNFRVPCSNSLFAYSAMCNFSGKKYPLAWVQRVQEGSLNSLLDEPSSWYCLLDAATYCSTNELNLSLISPDFVCISFYKLFGYPTGLGCLLIRNASAGCLEKRYYGGGTVDISVPSGAFYKLRNCLHESFEDGTLPFLSIIALGHALDTFNRLSISLRQISIHTFLLAKHLVEDLKKLTHWNGAKLAEIYSDSQYDDINSQGGIVAFNLKRSDGGYIGFIEVLHIANLHKIHLRTGCFCNVGACQKYLNLTDEDLVSHFHAGHICGDERDLVSGRPTGAVRVSFGYPSTAKDVHTLLTVLRESFIERKPANVDCNILLEPNRPFLQSIRLYPVKSCGAMVVSSWHINKRGLRFDRQWMVVSANGVCLTQKQEPQLCRVLPTVDPKSGVLTLSFSGEDSITVAQSATISTVSLCTNKVCGDRVQGEDCGDDVADWLSWKLQRDGLRLVRQVDEDHRVSKVGENRFRADETAGQLSLANQAQYLLVNTSSVDWLKRKVVDEPGFNCSTLVDRFRANFIISGASEFEELEWEQIQIGSLQFKVEGSCTRCQMICIDQQTGEKNRKPLVELSRALEGKMRFGVYCSHVTVAEDAALSVHDTVTIQKRQS